ncbi:MAG: hypothetical protein KF731_03045 [Thauera sp.]|nr:hypothetical protein [Thauera sp.]
MGLHPARAAWRVAEPLCRPRPSIPNGELRVPRQGRVFPFISEGEHHVRNPHHQSVAPDRRVAGRFGPCPARPAHTGRAGVVEAAAHRSRAVRPGVRVPRGRRLIMSISLYRRRIAATAIQLAKDDPSLVKEVIARLRESGEIEADDLVYLDRIADRWMRIAEANGNKAASAHPRQTRG